MVKRKFIVELTDESDGITASSVRRLISEMPDVKGIEEIPVPTPLRFQASLDILLKKFAVLPGVPEEHRADILESIRFGAELLNHSMDPSTIMTLLGMIISTQVAVDNGVTEKDIVVVNPDTPEGADFLSKHVHKDEELLGRARQIFGQPKGNVH